MGFFQDLGKTVSNIGKGVVDVVKASHAQPIADAYQSVTGKKVNINYNTATGKTVATGFSVVGNTSSALAKGIVNNVSGGMATKATNSWRPVESRDGDGTSILGPTKGGFAQLQAEEQAKADAAYLASVQAANATEKTLAQTAIMASQVGIANMPKAALPLISVAKDSGYFTGKFWSFIFA